MIQRRDVRLKQYDYSSAGAYFVTICTQDRRCILSRITDVGGGVPDAPQVQLTEYGAAVEQTLLEIDRTYDSIFIDKYVIMPNHVHFIVSVTENGTSGTPSPTDRSGSACATLPMLISTFKRFSNKKCGVKLWQRSYYEHVIRNLRDYEETWTYIDENPAKWADDRYFAR